MKVQLINLGRNKVNEIVYPADMKYCLLQFIPLHFNQL